MSAARHPSRETTLSTRTKKKKSCSLGKTPSVRRKPNKNGDVPDHSQSFDSDGPRVSEKFRVDTGNVLQEHAKTHNRRKRYFDAHLGRSLPTDGSERKRFSARCLVLIRLGMCGPIFVFVQLNPFFHDQKIFTAFRCQPCHTFHNTREGHCIRPK